MHAYSTRNFKFPKITTKYFCREISKALLSPSVISSRKKGLLKRNSTSLRVE
jgi:hypothetical protein